jgi:aspartyl-tRNA synthetase
MGKLVFGKLRDNTGDIQMCFMRENVVFNTGKPHPQPFSFGVEGSNSNSPSPSKEKGLGDEVVKVTELEIGGEMKSAFKIAEKFCQVGDYIGIE